MVVHQKRCDCESPNQMKIVPLNEIPTAKLIPPDVDTTLLKKLWVFTEDMIQLCLKEDGIGLHAVQVGLFWDLFIVNVKAVIPSTEENKFYRYFNCNYEPWVALNHLETSSERIKSTEGCLSLNTPEKRYFEVMRHERVIITGKILKQNLNNKVVAENIQFDLGGLGAIVMQHEIDHGKGITIDKIGTEVHAWRE